MGLWSDGQGPSIHDVLIADMNVMIGERGAFPQPDGGDGTNSYRGAAERPGIVPSMEGTCPSGYGTIYKYDGTTECADPRQPNIADVIAAETAPGLIDRATIGIADTLKTGVDAASAAGRGLGNLANPFGSWIAALVWVAVIGGSLYALARARGR